MTHKSYDTYSFTTDKPAQLTSLVDDYADLFTGVNHDRDILRAWTLWKPVARVEISPEPSHDRVAAFLDQLADYFHFSFDGYMLYVSRFPQLPALTADTPGALKGLLFGYPPRDVAEYCARHDGDITPVDAPPEEASPSAHDRAPDLAAIKQERDAERAFFIDEGINSPDDFDDYASVSADN